MAQNSKLGRTYSTRPSNIILPKSKSLSVQTIKTWKDALALAQLAEGAQRLPLLAIYDNAEMDGHLGSVMESRSLKIQSSKFITFYF